MPTYRIVSELDRGDEHRVPRGARLCLDEARLDTRIDAPSLAAAAAEAHGSEPHRERRIVSVEEVHPGFAPSDDDITDVLTSPVLESALHRAEFASDTGSIYGNRGSRTFLGVVSAVAECLRESGFVPGLSVSVVVSDHAVVEIFDDVREIRLSRDTETRHLTDDRAAVGWDGVLAVARAVIRLSNDLH